MTANRINRILIALIAAITVIGAVVWDYYTPYTADDNYYRAVIKPEWNPAVDDWPSTTQDIESFELAWQSVKNHCLYNGRLANFTHILFQPTGHTPEAVFLGLCIGLAFIMLCATGKGRDHKITVTGSCAAAIALWTVFPWYDQFQSLNFQINYLPASALTLILMYLATHGTRTNAAKGMLFSLGGMICAWLHEGFGSVALVYFIAIVVLGDKSTRKRCLFIIAGLILGIAINIYLGTANRIGVHTSEGWYIGFQFVVRLLPALWPEWLATLIVAIEVIIMRNRRKAFFGFVLPLLLAAWSGVAMAIIVGLIDHVLWPAHLYSAVILCNAVNRFTQGLRPKWQTVVGIVFGLLYLWWMCQLCMWSRITGDEVRSVFAIHGKPSDDAATVFFIDYHKDSEIPYPLMGIDRQPLDHNSCAFITGSYLRNGVGSLLVLPAKYEGKPFEEWPKIPGNNNLRGVYPQIASKDSTDFSVMLHFGAAEDNVSPVNRLFMMLKEGPTNDASIQAKLNLMPVKLPDGSIVYRCNIEPLPRTITGRTFKSLDIMPPR